jgi:FtsH-binding integral membrane protein
MTEQKAEMLRNVTAREHSIIKNVYLWMTAALAITAAVSYGVASSPSLMNVFLGSSAGLLLLIVAQFVIVFFLSARLDKMSQSAAIATFLAYSVVNGIMFSTLFYAYSLGTIYKAFFSATLMFAGMSVYAMTTKRDLNSWGYYLTVSLWGLVIASLMNMFFHSSGMDYILSFIGIGIFLGLTAWDTQKMVRVNDQYGYNMDEETYTKVSVVFALSLYLDFLNIFLYLLRLFGRNDRN